MSVCVYPFALTKSAKMMKRKLLVLVPFLIGIFVCINYYGLYVEYTSVALGHNVSTHLALRVWRDADDGGNPHLIDTVGCKIPRTDIMPEFFLNDWHAEKIPDCDYEVKLVQLHSNEVLEMLYPYQRGQCCLYEISRKPKDDSRFISSECQKIVSKFTSIKGIESFIVQCDSHIHMDSNIPIKKEVRVKLKAWDKSKKDKQKRRSRSELPVNFIIVGIDSMSRSHAFRSLPLTIDFIRKLEFIDFKAYHSLAPSTLSNFMGMLLGLTRSEVRSSCAKNWSTPFDNCSFIWGNFSAENYVTHYIEDGSSTFNWGDQSGFIDGSPTDYYYHHLFLALKQFRGNDLKTRINEDKYGNCASSLSVPEFMLFHLNKFFKTFQNYPFFSFTWFANPFHDYIYSLPHYDHDFFEFFQRLNSTKDIMENSVIIFLSDHGDRTSFFRSKSPESFIERGLPPLFIRFPEVLRRKYPEMYEALQSNSKTLITPFDIHHFLLHVLSLMVPNSREYESFSPQASDRSSLLVKVPQSRTCESTNVPSASCVCNVDYASNGSSKDTSVPQELVRKLYKFALAQLNDKIQKSEYKDLCAKWVLSSTLYVRKIMEGENYSEMLVAFETSPGEGKFESRVRVYSNRRKHSSSFSSSSSSFTSSIEDQDMEVVGCSRINKYGDSSWCVNSATDSDKEYKELCMCKSSRG